MTITLRDDSQYFHFPIDLLQETEINSIIYQAIVYAVYARVKSNGYEDDDFASEADSMGVTFNDEKSAMLDGKELYDYLSGRPHVGVTDKILNDFYGNSTKKPFEIDCFRAFCATRSIIGSKSHSKTNKDLIYARMFGYASFAEVPDGLPTHFEQYQKRYHMDKVLKKLQHDWYLKLVSNKSRGQYISYEMSLEDLTFEELKAKQKTKDNQLKQAKDEALTKAQERLKSEKHKISKPVKQV